MLDIYFRIKCRTLAAEYRLERLRQDLIERDRERLLAGYYD